jgi:hypothetical protein
VIQDRGQDSGRVSHGLAGIVEEGQFFRERCLREACMRFAEASQTQQQSQPWRLGGCRDPRDWCVQESKKVQSERKSIVFIISSEALTR